MKKIKLILPLLLLSCIGFAQIPALTWAKKLGGGGNDESFSVTVDGAGNVYTAGYFSGTADFNPGGPVSNLVSAGLADIFVSKLDAAGNFVWAKSMGGAGDDGATSIVLDATGNVYTTGIFNVTADFDPSAGTFNLTAGGDSSNIFISKLDALGNFVWAKGLSGASAGVGTAITIDGTNVYTTGFFIGTVDVDPGAAIVNLTAAGGYDAYISKLDAAGNYLSGIMLGGTGDDRGYSITTDGTGNVYSTGAFSATADFDPTGGTFNLTSAGMEDIYISKLNASGNFVSAQAMGGLKNDRGLSLKVDGSGMIYSTGRFDSIADFDPGAATFYLTAAATTQDIFVSKLDASGNYVWAKAMGGTNSDIAKGLAIDGTGNVYTTGYFLATADFNPGAAAFNLSAAGAYDAFMSKLDASGNYVWAKKVGGLGEDVGNSIFVDGIGDIYTTGRFNATVDFDPNSGVLNITATGGADAFVHKMSQTVGIFESSYDNSLLVSPNPSNGSFSIDSKLAKGKVEIYNVMGEKVGHWMLDIGKTEIDLSAQPKGIYFVRISGEEKIYSQKIVIQ